MPDPHEAFISKTSEKQKNQAAQGSAIAGAGGVVAGTGLIAGGVPGGKSDFSTVMDLKKPENKSVKGVLRAIKHNAKAAKATPGGILGFRSSAHRGGLYGFGQKKLEDEARGAKTPHEAFFQGRNAGKIKPEKDILRQMGRGKKAAGAALVGGTGLAAYGVKTSREDVGKRNTDQYNGALLGAGTAGAAVSHGGARVLRGQKRKWEGAASVHTDAAGILAPKIAGRKGNTMYPRVSDGEIYRNPSLLEGTKKKHARKAGALRGAAAQERHFAEVYGATEKVVGRFRAPSAAVAAAGAGGLYMSHKKKSQPVQKSKRLMSDAEIKRRKKLQGHISQTTGALGLTSLAAFTASKVPGAKMMTKTPRLRRIASSVNTKKAENIALGTSTAGAGIGGAGSFNFAAYTNAESRKRTQPVKKRGASAFGITHD